MTSKFRFILLTGLSALVLSAAIFFAFTTESRHHVTCPHEVFDGEILERGGYYYSEETGNRVYIPDNCLWERLDGK